MAGTDGDDTGNLRARLAAAEQAARDGRIERMHLRVQAAALAAERDQLRAERDRLAAEHRQVLKQLTATQAAAAIQYAAGPAPWPVDEVGERRALKTAGRYRLTAPFAALAAAAALLWAPHPAPDVSLPVTADSLYAHHPRRRPVVLPPEPVLAVRR